MVGYAVRCKMQVRVLSAITMIINPTHTPMPMRRDYHVVPDGYLWKVSQERNVMENTHFLTKAEAVGYGVAQARASYVSLIVHGKNGRIQYQWNYDAWVGPRLNG